MAAQPSSWFPSSYINLSVVVSSPKWPLTPAAVGRFLLFLVTELFACPVTRKFRLCFTTISMIYSFLQTIF